MSIEGGGGFRPDLYRRPTREDPYGLGIEVRGNNGAEDRVEKENSSWIAAIITPEGLAKAKQYPAFEGHSDEWIIMQALLAKSVESGPELDPIIRKRLSNLIGVMRLAVYPNLKAQEQDYMRELLSATTVNFSGISYEVSPDTREDMQWIWTNFNLQFPTGENGNLPTVITSTIKQLGLRTNR